MSKRSKTWLRRGISALLFVVLVYFFLPLLGELKAAAALFREANWIWFGIAILAQLISYACLTWLNCLALQPFEGKITFSRLAAVLTSMAFIQVAVPSMGISGVAMRVHLLKRSGFRAEDSLASLVVETLGEAIAITTLALLGVAFVLVPAAMWPSIPQLVAKEKVGTAFGLTTMIQNIGLALFPLLNGLLAHRTNSYTASQIMFACLGFAGLVFAFLLKSADAQKGSVLERPEPKP